MNYHEEYVWNWEEYPHPNSSYNVDIALKINRDTIFTLHNGNMYANGNVVLNHALNSIKRKEFIPATKWIRYEGKLP